MRCLMPLMMLLMMHQSQLHQPWRLDRCNPFIHCCSPPAPVSVNGLTRRASKGFNVWLMRYTALAGHIPI